ncbi:MAG: hypothetical protein KH332_03285 [Firmicutes bacterium]|jgi:hypothetical protein|nr:hypothetical protein [Bacillota bacterium]
MKNSDCNALSMLRSSPAITEKGTPCPLGMKKPIGPQEKDMDAFGFLYKLSGGGHSRVEQLAFTPD